jgi:hypothetical protein
MVPTPVSPGEVNGTLEEKLEGKGKEKEGAAVRKFRGVPEDVQLFEVFWKQVVELIKARPIFYLIAAWSGLIYLGPGSTGLVNTRYNGTFSLPNKSVSQLLSRPIGVRRSGLGLRSRQDPGVQRQVNLYISCVVRTLTSLPVRTFTHSKPAIILLHSSLPP